MRDWGKMMNDELAAIAGRYEEYVGKLQEKYGIAKEEARGEVEKFKKTIEQLKKSNSKLVQLQKSLHYKEKVGRRRVVSKTPKTPLKASTQRKFKRSVKHS